MWAVRTRGRNDEWVVIPFSELRAARTFAGRNPAYEVVLLAVCYLN